MGAPRILVTCWRRELPTSLGERTLLDTLDPAYADAVERAGGIPLIVPRPSGRAEPAAVAARLGIADGLLLTGGGDVEPSGYGAEPEDVADVDPDADAWELGLISAARALSLPTLAICRGAQLLAVAHGGALAQRPVPSDVHAERIQGASPAQILARRHPVRLAPGSRVLSALGTAPLQVNTIHRHRIADPGELEVTAKAPDGTIEAVEPSSPWSCVGVQWHPEKMRDDGRQQGLFDQLVSAARERETAVPGRRAAA